MAEQQLHVEARAIVYPAPRQYRRWPSELPCAMVHTSPRRSKKGGRHEPSRGLGGRREGLGDGQLTASAQRLGSPWVPARRP